MNTLLSTLSLLPIPGIDGGSAVKWALVQRGLKPQAADEVVVKVNRVTAAGLGVAAGLAFKQRRWLVGGTLSLFAALSLAIGLRILKENHAHIAENV